MVNTIQRDQRRRILYNKFEERRVLLKTLLQAAAAQFKLGRDKAMLQEGVSRPKKSLLKEKIVDRYNQIPRNSLRSRVRNRCVVTARGRGVLRFCKLSRIRIRELASQGLLSGVSKASW